MNLKTTNHLRWLTALHTIGFSLLLVITLVGCAVVPYSTFHSFQFDALRDSRDVEVLQYSYGEYGGTGTYSRPSDVNDGRIYMQTSTTGVMPVGKQLHVKWRIKSTGETLEDTVDLQERWSQSMTHQTLRFILENRQLYVYIISHEAVRPVFSYDDAARIRDAHRLPREKAFDFFLRNRIVEIYPDRIVDPHLPPALRK